MEFIRLDFVDEGVDVTKAIVLPRVVTALIKAMLCSASRAVAIRVVAQIRVYDFGFVKSVQKSGCTGDYGVAMALPEAS